MGSGSPVVARRAESLHSQTGPAPISVCEIDGQEPYNGTLETECPRCPNAKLLHDASDSPVHRHPLCDTAQLKVDGIPGGKEFFRQPTADTEAPSDDDRISFEDEQVVPWECEADTSLITNEPVLTSVSGFLESAMKEAQTVNNTTSDLNLPGYVQTSPGPAEAMIEDVLTEDPEISKVPRRLSFVSSEGGSRNTTPRSSHCRIRSPFKRIPPKSPAAGSCTPKSQRSVGSLLSDAWDAPSETLIFLDWDDTLCPTTSCTNALIGRMAAVADDVLMLAHEAAVVNFLKTASELGQPVIVTMAQKSWVHTCIAKFMPQVADVLAELKIEIISARESLPQRLRRSALSDDRDPSQYLKFKAMEKAVKQFYKHSRARPRSWKNVISMGDSCAERLAVQDLVFRRVQRGGGGDWKECRCKTLLLLEDPTLEHLTQEIRLMTQLLPVLVRHDGDIHVDISVDDLESR